MNKPDCVVQLGRFGDLILMLPAFKKMKERSGVNPVVMVSHEYASVLDGVSYVTPWVVPLHWANDVMKARKAAETQFENVIVPAWWNDAELVEKSNASLAHVHEVKVRINGADLKIDPKDTSYMVSMWNESHLPECEKSPVLFDRRRPYQESLLCEQFLHIKKPTVLYNMTGTSSPFPFQHELHSVMREFKDHLHFVDIGEIKADRIYDLLGLYDTAVGLITTDTATLHLAPASKIPYVGITNDGWSGSVCKGNCVLSFKYSQTLNKIDAIRKALKVWVHQYSPRQKIDRNYPPSILEQTPWPCKILDTPREYGDFFNPGLVTVKGQDYLFARRSHTPPGQKFSKNEICIFKLNDGQLSPHSTFFPISQFEGEHLEDPRVFADGGKLWLSCCNFVWNDNNKSTYTHQVLFELSESFKCLRRFDVPCIGNGSSLALNTRSEKNWLWFFKDLNPHLIYATEPHLVVEFNMMFNNPENFLTKPDYGWKYGEIRGGTPPIRIGDEYWSFFHSSLPAPEHNTRRYHMGAYAFSATAPFQPTRVTKEPILTGSNCDRFKPRSPLVVFPCGSKLDKGNWTVTFGVNDIDCGMIEIPHSELLPLMKNL
jgi:predicted GH43/DUF377 family glycosyl hydrolase